jgi:hypothetical protein
MALTIVPHPANILVGSISHIRHIVKRLELPEEYGAETKFQIGAKYHYCTEPPHIVVDLVDEARLASKQLPMATLTLPGGQPVWFAGELAEGPIKLLPGEIGDGIHSAFKIGDLLTRVRDMPDEVAEVIRAAGGKAIKPVEHVGLARQIKRKAA